MKEKGKLKVLGVNEEMSGSRMHRVVLPIMALNGEKVVINDEEVVIEATIITCENGNVTLTEEMFKEYDVVYCTWIPRNPAWQISVFKSQYSTKYILDMDDVIPDHKHAYYTEELKKESQIRILKLIMEADSVVVATKEIASYLRNETKYIHLSPNILPYGTGQFEVKEYVEKEGKLSIGIMANNSHFFDYKEISGIIKKIAGDSEIHKNAKFVLCGYIKGDSISEKIYNMFNCNKAMEVELVDYTSPNNYMELYNKIDILLAPLENNFFNQAKSNLKIAEAACYNIPVIGSELYMKKGLTAYCACQKPTDYYTFIKYFIKNRDKVKELGAKCGEENRKDAGDFSYRIEGIKNLLATIYNAEFEKERWVSPEGLELYGITYGSGQYTEYIPYDNSYINSIEQKSYLFEYNPIIDIINNKLSESTKYVGIFSWKFPMKTGLSKEIVYKAFNQNKEADVIGLCPQYFVGNYLSFTEEQHPGFMELFNLMCSDLGLEIKEPKNVVYSNMFIAKKQIYTKFVTEIIKPAIELMETKYKDLAWKDADYKSGVNTEALKSYTGLNFYTLHTFILERLLSIWLENNTQITFKQV
tara:strand:+ start:11870 stop:13630 length:1761 start_codon:yes stop_codon:yes gene_type:complete